MNCASVFKALQPRCPRWERRKDARPNELLAAALAAFVEKGYAGTRLEDVATRAGVSKGTLYLYFKGKEDTFEAVVREFAVRRADGARMQVAASGGSARERLESSLDGLWSFFADPTSSGLVKLILSEARNFPKVAEYYMEEVVRPTHGFLADLVREGIERGEFRPVAVDSFVQVLLAPLIMLALWQHSLIPCCVLDIDVGSYRDTQRAMVMGLLEPGPVRQAAGNAA